MRSWQAVVAAALVAVAVPSVAQAQLWFNGEWDGVDGLASERNSSVSATTMRFDNFVVTGSGWTITSLFGEFLASFTTETVDYEIRSGLSDGNGGTLLFSGVGVAATQVATGQSLNALTVYRTTVSGLSLFLGPGTYFLGISLVGTGTGRAYAATTSGTNGVGPLLDGDTWRYSPNVGVGYTLDDPSEFDFAYGVDGREGPQEVVPEPATLTLLATGLAGMAAARRRKATKA